MIEIPVSASVRFVDGCRGSSTHIVINLQSQRVTHVVVKTKGTPHADWLVPVALVTETSKDMIRLRCSPMDLETMMPCTRIEWTSAPENCHVPLLEQYLTHTAAIRPYGHPVKRKLIPPGQLAIGRNTRVTTINGQVGRVQKLLIYPTDARIMRVVIRTGSLWNQKSVIVPFRWIASFGREAVSAESDAPAVEVPPTISLSF